MNMQYCLPLSNHVFQSLVRAGDKVVSFSLLMLLVMAGTARAENNLLNLSLKELLHVEISEPEEIPLFWSNKTAPGSKTINVGLMVPFTSERESALELIAAAEFAAGEINQAGGINGQKLAIIVANDDFYLESEVSKIQELIDVHSIVALIGPMSSSSVIGVANAITVKSSLPTLPPAANANAISLLDDNDLVFRLPANNQQLAIKIAEFIKINGFKKTAIYYQDDVFGSEIYHGVRAQLLEQSLTVVDSRSFKLSVNYKSYSLKHEIQTTQKKGAEAVVLVLEQVQDVMEQFANNWSGPLPAFILPQQADIAKKSELLDVSVCVVAVIPELETGSLSVLEGIEELLSVAHSSYTSVFVYDSVYLIAGALYYQDRYKQPFNVSLRSITQPGQNLITNNFKGVTEKVEQHQKLSFIGNSGPVVFDKSGNNNQVSLILKPFDKVYGKPCNKRLTY